MYDLRKGDLFVLSWERVRRVRRGNNFSELLLCGGGVRNILLLPFVDNNRCVYMVHGCFYVCCSDSVGVCGNVCCVAAVVNDSVFCLWVLKYVVCLCKGCDGCVLYLYCEAWSCRCSCMGSVSVSSCRCCMFVSCVHPVEVLNTAFCINCSLLMLVEDTRGDHMEEAYSRAVLNDCLVCNHECLRMFTPSRCG